MQQRQRSATAWAVALRRAVHQLVDRPLVLEDSLAVRVVGESAAQEAAAKEDAAGVNFQRFARVMRAAVVGRSRLAEDQLAAAVAGGVRQYVVLGAGMDTFGQRNVHGAKGLRVWEVDHPATQAWKRELLALAGIVSPQSLTFVPVDFERQMLGECLMAAGFAEGRPAMFSWLGVVPYLTREAFEQTLHYLGRRPAGSAVVFDYAIGLEGLGMRERMALDMLAKRVEAVGEPFRLFVPVEEMHRELRAAGFGRIDDLDGEGMNGRYFGGRTDGLSLAGRLGRFCYAGIEGG